MRYKDRERMTKRIGRGAFQHAYISYGICDACGKPGQDLKIINQAPVAGAAICEQCRTKQEWPPLPELKPITTKLVKLDNGTEAK